MAVKGLDIFKLSPKTNCKDCGCPTCMAFCMKVAQGALPIDKCPHMSQEAVDMLSEATAPPMKTIKAGEIALGGETVMFRHEKTFVNRPVFANIVCDCMDAAEQDAKIANIGKVDYDRIGERMYVELFYVNHGAESSAEAYTALVEKAVAADRPLVLGVSCPELAAKAIDAAAGKAVILNGANAENYAEMSKLATEKGLVLGVSGKDLNELYDTVKALEGLGNKNLILDVGSDMKEGFANAVKIRRAALKNGERSFGYPSLVNVAKMANREPHMEAALASLFTARYGSVIVMDEMDYAKALPLYALRQNLFTDPQKPMKVEPGIYAINGAGPDDPCCTTVDFALTYFVVSGELERSGVPVNLLISDAGGYSVLTSWAAGKFSAGSITKFITENDIASKINNRTLIIPGKVAVLKGELQEKLPDWEIVVAPTEAVHLVKFLRDNYKK